MSVPLLLPRLGFGTAPLGNLFTSVTDEDAYDALHCAYKNGMRFFDTAPQYGLGLAEQRLGIALRNFDRSELVISSKVGRLVDANGPEINDSFVDLPHANRYQWDFSRDGVLRSIEASCRRLGVDRLDVVYVHDPDRHEDDAMNGAFPALIELRSQGVLGAVGCGMNQSEMLTRFVDRVDLDVILLAGRWTLIDHSGEPLLDRCVQRNVQVVCGGVFNSGILANPSATATYDYAPADPDLVQRARDLAVNATAKGETLIGQAIRFPFTHPAVTSVLLGMRSSVEVLTNLGAFREHESPAFPSV
jgi:D-threo-aldose 1-dehydrogenase